MSREECYYVLLSLFAFWFKGFSDLPWESFNQDILPLT